jgi:uncharacterized protein YacL
MGIKEWLQNLVFKKGIRSGVGVLVALLCSGMIANELQKYGVTINKAEMEVALTVLISGGLEALRTWIKSKTKMTWL